MDELKKISSKVIFNNGKKTEFYYIEHLQAKSHRNIVFIHGANHAAWCWNAYFMNFFYEKGYNVYSVNLYNRGNSSRIEKALLSEYVEQINDFVEYLDKKIIIVGHSVGTSIVQKYISKYKESVEKCILMCPVAPWGMKYDLITMFHKSPMKKILLALYNIKIIKKYPVELFFEKKPSCIKNECFIPENFNECFFVFLEKSEINKNIPILILGSKNDQVINYKSIYKMVTYYNSEFVIYNNIGHDMMLDFGWEIVAVDILKYISNFYDAGEIQK
ncbi:TPA: alpha/beta hydrolase [Streptococcus agalactiae]|jgi:hydrolase, alpha/beta domain protein|nr:alpha/beta hydrolase [Streptococcus suis]HEO5788782.1 alpha/beta hydrolase [Streptococcus agalactiae]HEO5790391.1 alpha/beta hydrolase [Streptococcus agalactiae]